MDDQNNDTTVGDVIEDDTPETELTDATDWEAEAKKARGIAQRLRTKLTKATEKKVDKPEKVESKVEPVKEVSKTGELDETQLDYLDLKGITDQDEIDLIQKVMKNTGQTVRQALKDEYVQAKLDEIRKTKAVKDATPSGTKRSGSQSSDLAAAIAKYDSTNVLPDDFALRTAVINAKIAKDNPNKPSWR